ncbi:MAG: glycosyltransferase family 39 protein [Eubacteriales bacterium]|nr:glycosyltransferase family 39 protein [Eubacteriales bacterium]
MSQKRSFLTWLSDAAQWVTALLSFVAFALLAAVSLVQTCHVDIGFSKDNSEHVSFLNDNIILNLILLAAFVLLAVLIMRAAVKRKTVVWVGMASIVASAGIGVWWVLSSKALPGADSLQIITTAQKLISGDVASLADSQYFRIYPYQTGYLLFAEGFLRLFGSNQLTLFQLLNVGFVALGQVAMLKITKELFDDPRVELLTAILLGLCIQPTLLSTFLYGTLPGMALAIWSVYFSCRAIRRGSWKPLIASAVLIAVAILLKKNFWIVLLAEALMLLFFALKERKWAILVCLAGMTAISLVLPTLAQKYYENRADTAFGKGTPQMAWLVTGFRDSSFCAGWYNGYTNNLLRDNDFDYDKALAQSKADFKERADTFAARPVYFASFFYHKIVSQWNEPAFQSIWSSAAADRSGEVSEFIKSLGTGEAGEAVNAYLNQLMQFVYVAMALGFFALLIRKSERDEARAILPLILVGAAMYHALFEAKAQYAIIYIPMMLPYAAFGMKWVSEKLPKFRRVGKAENSK